MSLMKTLKDPSLALHEPSQLFNPHTSVWVEAAAGTGKTKLLIDRVLSLLLHGVDPEKILCITFTNAAASEMQARIQETLSKWADMGREALEKEVAFLCEPTPEKIIFAASLQNRLQQHKGKICIQTIHGFCRMFLSQNCFEAGLLPGFEVWDSSQIKLLWEEIFDKKALSCEKDFPLLTRHVSYEGLCALTYRLLEEKGLQKGEGAPSNTIEEWLKPEITKKEEDWAHVICSLQMFLRESEGQRHGLTPADETLFFALEKQMAEQNIPALQEIFLTKDGKKKKKLLSASLGRTIPALEASLQAIGEKIEALVASQQLMKVRKSSRALLALFSIIEEGYRQYKREHNILSYDDLIEKALDLLTSETKAPWIFYKMGGGWDHILLDEAQDTNRAQWGIIRGLTSEAYAGAGTLERPTSIFIVGDKKQSIFSFQGADPSIYQENKTYFQQKVEGVGHNWLVHKLDKSYRSCRAILEVVDAVLAEPQIREALNLHEPMQHFLHRIRTPGVVEIWPLTLAPETQCPQPWVIAQEGSPLTAEGVLSLQIAHKIKNWLTDKRLLVGQGRPVQAGDILILLRRRGTFMENLIRALKYYDVPVAGHDRLDVMNHIVVQDLLAVAEFLLLSSYDLKLATILKSPLFGWTEEEVYALIMAAQNKKQNLWETLSEHKGQKIEWERSWQDLWDLKIVCEKGMMPDELFGEILFQKKGWDKFLARLGSECEDVLGEFLNLSEKYTQTEGGTLQHFIQWMHSHQHEIKRNMEQGKQNEVRIMTVHGAKGLQAPIVFLPDTTQVPSEVSPFLFLASRPHQDALLWLVDGIRQSPLFAKELEQEKKKQVFEYYRLLYVALTRAQDELYIGGVQPARKIDEKSWYPLIKKAIKHQLA